MTGLLIDTPFLLWTAFKPENLSAKAKALISSTDHTLHFSWVSLWEVAIKSTLARGDFNVDVQQLHAQLLQHGFVNLPIALSHFTKLTTLPLLHGDPFDRLLIAQASTEGLTLLTADRALAAYGPMVKVV
jgi:PIN domain nuclease of toxin-antitoxin system